MSHTIWVEKYRPTALEEYIGNDAMKAKFGEYIATQDIPHLLLVGSAGTGKTTAAKILIQNIDCDSLILNASDDNNIETVRTKIQSFAATQSMTGLKIILLDEADFISMAGQAALRNVIEKYSLTTRFILTANYAERIIPPLVSRTQQFEITPPSKKQVCQHVYKILQTEQITCTPQQVKTLVGMYFPDIRKVINQAQLSVANNVLVLDESRLVSDSYRTKLIELLTSGEKPVWIVKAIRQHLADQALRDYIPVYRHLFDTVDTYAGPNVSAAILAIAEGMYRDALVPDKEINMTATVIKLVEAIT